MKMFVILVLAVATTNAASFNTLVTPAFSSGRIVNGIEATPGEAPFIVSLQRLDGFHFCAGSAITSKVVLTAGHCLGSSSFKVVGGLHDRTIIDDPSFQVRMVESSKQIAIHEGYTGGVGPNDIGLIYLNEPFVFEKLSDGSPTIAPISLPSGRYAQTGEGRLHGWGRNASSQSPERLHALDVDIIGYSQCKSELPFGAPLDEFSNICTHAPNKIDGACNGDSGGPLSIKTNEGEELVGVVSWGYSPCHWSTYPSVYTMVSEFLDWIGVNVEKLELINNV